jgi:DNA-binding cell septation regulator SpoVG
VRYRIVGKWKYDLLLKHNVQLMERNDELAVMLDDRRAQVRDLRRAIHRLRSEVGAAVNTAVREAHAPPSTRKDEL